MGGLDIHMLRVICSQLRRLVTLSSSVTWIAGLYPKASFKDYVSSYPPPNSAAPHKALDAGNIEPSVMMNHALWCTPQAIHNTHANLL
jgi:hypothetical protein